MFSDVYRWPLSSNNAHENFQYIDKLYLVFFELWFFIQSEARSIVWSRIKLFTLDVVHLQSGSLFGIKQKN
jgi:hypothetical protein